MSSSENTDGALATSPTAGYTKARLLEKLAAATGDRDSAKTAEIYEAITAAGRIASTWMGEDWWWMHATGSFTTVDGTASYALRTVNSSAMANLYAIEQAWLDDEATLTPVRESVYRTWHTTVYVAGNETKPTHYVQTGEAPVMWLQGVPDDAYTINIRYKKKHPVIDAAAANADLLIPSEFQDGIYYAGALFLLRNEIDKAASLDSCPAFIEAINRMYQNNLVNSDWDSTEMFSDHVGMYPHDRAVLGGMTVNPLTTANP